MAPAEGAGLALVGVVEALVEGPPLALVEGARAPLPWRLLGREVERVFDYI